MMHGRNSTYNTPLSTAYITHDGDGSEQVDPRLTLYKKNKFHSPKVSSNNSLFSILVS